MLVNNTLALNKFIPFLGSQLLVCHKSNSMRLNSAVVNLLEDMCIFIYIMNNATQMRRINLNKPRIVPLLDYFAALGLLQGIIEDTFFQVCAVLGVDQNFINLFHDFRAELFRVFNLLE